MQKFQKHPQELSQISKTRISSPKSVTAKPPSVGSVQRDKASPQESFADFQARLGVPVQAKLTVTPAGDKYEQEADAVADQVMQTMRVQRMDDEDMMMQRVDDEDMMMQRMDDEDMMMQRMDDEDMMMQRMDDEDMMMQRQTDFTGGGVVGGDVEGDIQSARGGGQAMPDTLRSPLESAFGTDFSNVRVHTDSDAHALNRSVQAKAFTTGNDIFFSKGTYNPESESGQRLLAHELTHVVQQGASKPSEQKKTLNDTKITPQQNAPLSLQRGVIKETLNEITKSWTKFKDSTNKTETLYIDTAKKLYTKYRKLRPATKKSFQTRSTGKAPSVGSFEAIHDESMNDTSKKSKYSAEVKEEMLDRAVRFAHWSNTAHESAERIYEELRGALDAGIEPEEVKTGSDTKTEPDVTGITLEKSAENRHKGKSSMEGGKALESKRVSSPTVSAVDGHIIAASEQLEKRNDAKYKGLIAHIHVVSKSNTYPFTHTEFVKMAVKDGIKLNKITTAKTMKGKANALIDNGYLPKNTTVVEEKLKARIENYKPFDDPEIEYRITSELFKGTLEIKI
ncbi:MAG: DUF4157 domain-containing protein [Chloroflexota bacterium]